VNQPKQVRWWRRLDATQVTGGFIAEVGGASALTLAVQPPTVDNVKYITGRNLRDTVNFSRFKSISGGDSRGWIRNQRKQYSVIITAMPRLPPVCQLRIQLTIAFATLAVRSVDVAGFSSLSLTFVASFLPISNLFALL